ncbi:MAG: hypothetical protein ACI8VC_002395 [Candidatus Endobugula sp.]|jgi:hypothetical protein
MTAQANIQNQNLPAQKSNTAINKMTKAMAEIDQKRDQLNDGAVKLMAEDFSCVVYLRDDRLGRPCAAGYCGRGLKPKFSYYYGSIERRNESVTQWMESIVKEKKQRKTTGKRELIVGDVLRSTWGYEQTNIDYYLVTRLVGAASVEMAEIGCLKTFDDIDRGQCLPDVGDVFGEPMIKRVNGVSVKINSFSHASKLEKINGEFKSSYWSSYA